VPRPDRSTSTDVLEPMPTGPWTPESLDLLIGLGGVFGTAQALTPAGEDYSYFEFSTPVQFANVTLWLFILANEDPSAEDPTRWAWHVEVRTREDFEQGRMLASEKSRTRDKALTMACEVLNVLDGLTTDSTIHITELQPYGVHIHVHPNGSPDGAGDEPCACDT
jgi:hypothetical protein